MRAQNGAEMVKLGQKMAESHGGGVCVWCDVFMERNQSLGSLVALSVDESKHVH